MPRKIIPLETRFWTKVDKTGDCWVWTGCLNNMGYGQIQSGGRQGKCLLAHRTSWEMANGPIPKGMAILHKCDNPKCVRPDHLRVGTKADNSMDMAIKRRGTASLSDEQVILIRASQGIEGKRVTAARFGISHTMVRYIQRGLWYRHVNAPN